MPIDDAALSPDERFHEVARILATGLLRLKSRPHIADEPADTATEEASNSCRKPLGLTPKKRLHVLTG